MSAEDAPDDTIRPRLEAAGANLDRIHDLSCIVGRGDRPPEIPGDLPLIAAKLLEVDARLFIVDPLMAFLADVDANKDQSVRRALYQLSKIIEATRTASTCMRHLNKGSGTKAIYRGNSSIGVIGHARAGLLVAEDPDDNTRRILAVTKSNLAAKPQSLKFYLAPTNDICSIQWEGHTTYKADDLLAPPPTLDEKEQKETEQDKLEYAKEILKALLDEYGGKVAVKLAKSECAEAGVSQRAAERAAKKLDLELSFQMVDGKRCYYWSPKTDGELAE